jgi:hypothetical protein
MRAGDGSASASMGLQVAGRCSPSPSPVVVASHPRRSLMVPQSATANSQRPRRLTRTTTLGHAVAFAHELVVARQLLLDRLQSLLDRLDDVD